MRRLLPLCLCILMSHPASGETASAPDAADLSPQRLERARAVLRGAVESRVAGSAVGLIARGGQVVFLEAFGAMEPGVPMTTDAITRWASITKPITAVAVMMLYEEGRLRLADPVARFIPEFEAARVESADGSTSPLERPITIQDLLTHRAGLPADGPALDELWQSAKTAGEFARGLAGIPLRSQPGRRFEYGPAYEVLSAVVERASRAPFDEFLRQRIFAPLDMKDTSFHVPEDKRERYAGIYQKTAEGELTLFRRRGQEEAPTGFFSGGGGLRGTIRDYHRFAQMLLNGGEIDGVRLLSPRSVELMTTDHTGGAGDGDDGYGFGVGVRARLKDGGPGSAGSYGWNGGTGTLFLVDPVEELVVVVFVPSQPRTPGVWSAADVRKDFVTAACQAVAAPPPHRPR